MERDGVKYSFEQDEQTPFVNRKRTGCFSDEGVITPEPQADGMLVIAKNFNAAQNNILPISPIEMPPNKSNINLSIFMATSNMSELLKTIPQIGKVEWIGVRRERKKELIEVTSALITTEDGLIEDHYSNKGGKRQVTLIQAEHLLAVAGMLQQKEAISPFLTRRNIAISSLNLNALKDQQFSIGNEVILEGTGYCHPCSRMEENLGQGGYNAMRGHGGITAKVIRGGTIKTGDPVSFIATKIFN